jgi:Pvc16 N-terminal domain
MALVVQVPLNTALADLDEGLRALLRRELERHGFEGVEIAFDAPSSDWSGQLTGPAVNLFLYDLREFSEGQDRSPSEVRDGNGARMTPPPLRLEVTYAITAWTQAVEDEHRLLSQVLAVLYSYRNIPTDVLPERLANNGRHPIEGTIGRPQTEKADFWTSVGGRFKASLDYAVRVSVESGAVFTRGPEVRTQSVRARLTDGPPGAVRELHRFGGKLVTADDQPLTDAWVAMPDAGRWTSTNREGQFIFDRIVPGKHHVVARTLEGGTVEADVEIPGPSVELVIGTKGKGSKK